MDTASMFLCTYRVNRMLDNWTRAPYAEVKRMLYNWTLPLFLEDQRMPDNWTQPLVADPREGRII